MYINKLGQAVPLNVPLFSSKKAFPAAFFLSGEFCYIMNGPVWVRARGGAVVWSHPLLDYAAGAATGNFKFLKQVRNPPASTLYNCPLPLSLCSLSPATPGQGHGVAPNLLLPHSSQTAWELGLARDSSTISSRCILPSCWIPPGILHQLRSRHQEGNLSAMTATPSWAQIFM